ncbi:U6 snRNA-associated Sm-like protein LSm1 isoform X2 [Marmota monax]|uniref:U6 snRNA-associated Sm-like protein LSm1 isoform X2 n=1 Tax=Marmota marmota marmota TaxID=9994 RepID=UPI0007626B99|nr:U6 snRNA-associated Sm-like protein LSm1 isoform X2 [Marmota marmota marmota]XP_046319827.1 U6 snRNA-associated Sm-like protein LSm1 isoform X2 [Marmota monax]
MNYMPGTASLIEDIDKKHLVLLRDGRTLIGFLRSIDQFANLVLHQTVERIHVGKKYGDIPRGIFVVRGENVVLLGEIKSFQAQWHTPAIPAAGKLRQEDCKFEISLDILARPCLKKGLDIVAYTCNPSNLGI